jgi:hypothetical protein
VRILCIPVASIIAALSLFSVGAFAATTPDTTTASSSDASEVPTVCLIDTAPTSSSNTTVTATTTTAAATATPTATTTAVSTTAGDDDVSNTAEDTTGQAIRACIAALHDDGQHGIGQTVSELAHELKAGRQADDGRVSADDDSSPLVSVTPTATSTTTTSASIVTPATIAQDRDQKPTSEHGNSRGGKHGHG